MALNENVGKLLGTVRYQRIYWMFCYQLNKLLLNEKWQHFLKVNFNELETK